jgi:hypothetical protein
MLGKAMTLTVKEQEAVLPALDAVHVTVVEPSGKDEPEAGVQVTCASAGLTVGAG